MRDYEKFKLGNIKLLSGKTLRSAELAYKTYGKLNKSASNVIILPTFYTGSHIRNEGFIGKNRELLIKISILSYLSICLAMVFHHLRTIL